MFYEISWNNTMTKSYLNSQIASNSSVWKINRIYCSRYQKPFSSKECVHIKSTENGKIEPVCITGREIITNSCLRFFKIA